MSWFPILAASTIAAVTFFGVGNPSRAFTLLLYIAAVLFGWFVFEGWKALKSSSGRIEMTQE